MLSLSILFGVFITIAGIYYLLIILILVGLSKKRPIQITGAPFFTSVTVVIPARNEEKNILHCLNDLVQQEFPENLMEIIVIDDGSFDQTFHHVTKFAGENPSFPITILRIEPHPQQSGSKKRAIDLAISQSKGELILTTDADTRFGKKWIASMVTCFEKFHSEMVLGPVAFINDPALFSTIQSCEFMGLMAVTEGSCAMGRPLMCNGANLGYSRKAFDAVSGFKDNMNIPSGDDMFLMMKIRKKFGRESVQFNRCQDAIVLTEANRTIPEFLHQRLRWVSKNKRYKDPVILIVAGVTYLFNFFLLFGIITGFFFHPFWILTLFLLVGKTLIEYPMLHNYAAFLGKTKNLKFVLLAQLLNIFYVSVIGFLGNFVSFEWKGRKINPIKKL